MLNRIVTLCAPVLAVGILFGCAGSQALAEDAAPWRVSKSSGDVWMTTSGVQEASLTSEATLKPGDSIRTGRSGRVLLTRGEETILISPNSVIALPEQQKDGLSTTIIEQAGSVLIQAEKRNVKHFQVETPYLAAVVKGTQFRVSVTERGGSVEVIEGRVEVADFKTGQFALVLPGQAAKVAALGRGGETGWVAYLSTTDAVCYHDGHRSLDAYERGSHPRGAHLRRRRRAARRAHHPRHRHGLRRRRAARPGPLPLRLLARARVPAEDDRHRAALPARRLYAAQESAERRRRRAARHLPPPGDPDLRRRARRRQRLPELDEAVGDARGRPDRRATASISTCTPRSSRPAPITAGACSTARAKALGTLILGGGVPKNYNLQPEPALGQVLGLPDVRGYTSTCRS